MALNFPDSPSVNDTYSVGGFVHTWNGTVWKRTASVVIPTADNLNRIVNPAMQVSQENGNTSGVGSSYFAADQWHTAFAGTAVVTTQRVQVETPNGSPDRFRITITTGASLAATDQLRFQTNLEGSVIADFLYGTANAKQTVARFGFKGPAGTYALNIRNDANDRSYCALFTISAGQANTDTEQVFVIPGDITGTWLSDYNRGMIFTITLAAGTTYQGSVNTWQAGQYMNTAACSNGMATTGAVFELFDVGLYLDLNNTGLPPLWQLPLYHDTLLQCMRYYFKGIPQHGAYHYAAYAASCIGAIWNVLWPVRMRTNPTISKSFTGATYGGGFTNPPNVDLPFDTGCRIYGYSTAAAGAAGVVMAASNYIVADARM